ncbi:MAG: anhydro-N-acetylmuramic acid kinase [Lysobacter sp.]|nr:anhydro-N-acetylmuramic acid kinase [Lysobacter sp.]MDQ3269887.1 anhydro-N-acetylmuramic acid kinase [Pseudomonadota bacterium]
MAANATAPASCALPGVASTPLDGAFVGLISGTSADGIDAALVEFSGHACSLRLGRTYPWDPALRERLVALGQGGAAQSIEELGTLDVRIGEAFAAAATMLIREAGACSGDIRAIGSHGQTVRHRPAGALGDGLHPFTWQLGDAAVIAERCRITTIADFRRRDVAAGGQGAPLVPAFHAAMLQSPDEDRAVLNLGGIGNFTLLPKDAATEPHRVRGFDTGPANALMDAWCERHQGRAFDAGGEFAARGSVDTALLLRLLDEPWFARPPPKSTGREQFHLAWLEERLTGSESAEDVQATLLELSAVTVANLLQSQQPQTRRLLACGGGVRNERLMARIAELVPQAQVESTAGHGLDPDFLEAMAFAWLARQTLAGLPGNLPAVTGARGPRVLGAIHLSAD